MAYTDDLIVRSAQDLNDYIEGEPNRQFQRWSRNQLTAYWNEALCIMFSLNPSKFKKAKVAKLVPGINQTFEGCKRVLSIIGVSDKDGNVLYEIEQDKEDKKLKWGGYRPRRCVSLTHTADFKLASYRIMSDKDGSVFVKPEVPYGKDIYIKYMCETPPEPIKVGGEISDTDCANIALGIHWVLFRALMVDEESQASNALASNHLQLFFKLLEVKIDLEKEKGFNLESVPKALQQYVAREIAKYKIGAK